MREKHRTRKNTGSRNDGKGEGICRERKRDLSRQFARWGEGALEILNKFEMFYAATPFLNCDGFTPLYFLKTLFRWLSSVKFNS
jgi:hypothetical protein